jgi:DNA-binding LacI/PurR family transcriptional regulator
MKRRPSITDIAAEAGVSTATVSLALRDKGRMSQETRDRVKATAGRLGYVPNATARSLVGGRTQLISISMPAISEAPGVVSSVEYFFRLLGAVAASALELDYGLVVTSPSDRPDRVAVDGAVVVDPSHDDPTIAAFDELGRPVVTIGRRLDPIGSGAGPELKVDSDFHIATHQVLDHLASQGAQTIALLAAEPIDSFQQDSIDAYLDWCRDHEVEPRVVMADSPESSKAEIAAAAVTGRPDRPDGVYATVDTLAESLLETAIASGLEVPGDMLIATCSDGHIARSATPKLTTIDEKPMELAQAAVTMLVGAILEPDSGAQSVQVDTELLLRASTGN